MAKKPTDTEEASAQRVRDAVAAGTLTSDQPTGQPNVATAPKPPRDKAAKFRLLANTRLPKLIKIARQVANLANRGSYTFDEEQRQKLLKIVSDAGKVVLDAFTNGPAADGKGEPLF